MNKKVSSLSRGGGLVSLGNIESQIANSELKIPCVFVFPVVLKTSHVPAKPAVDCFSKKKNTKTVEIVIDSIFFFAKSQTRNWDNIVGGGLLQPSFSTKLNKIKMKNIVTTALLCAAAVSANAWTTALESQIWMQDTEKMTYKYEVKSTESLVPMNGGYVFWETKGYSGAQDINSPVSTKIDFTEDARYEFKFNVRFLGATNNGALPYCNLTLVTSSNDASILFGNADDSHCQFGVIPQRDVTVTPGHESLCANSAGSLVYSTAWSGPITAGFYEYTLIFETFSDAATDDKIYFGIKSKDSGRHVAMLQANATHLGLGGFDSKVFDDIGFSIYGAGFTSTGGTETVDGLGGVKLLRDGSTLTTWTRTATPVEEPAVPEPSAFGLLAGLGAVALAVSRRRRSR